MDWYLECFRKYAVFSGRARRREYFTFFLANWIISGILSGIASGMMSGSPIYAAAGIYNLVVLVPQFAVGIRRLHDTGKSGWWTLISIIPGIGWIIWIIFMLKDSDYGNNRYGPNPKGEG